ncbi:hypothetical protein VAE151_630564 [Vibrio aestuarianus]|uniref:Uncharacterized protein n=1 Tax=Vibrio aestuarianus TaxID=28171 RepID=A0ABN8TJZ1_9VIBR|nr:hypothetical protein VAE063_1010039 [Vibrio aestuarianus]CAH8225016.1 hypothetical protein VIBAE_B10649 [Vibrio aestuarianus subsp. francensis]CAH8221884.1 hypothetical protein VAE308_1240002 [Vibrio aestuarianus]CAH8226666.1 hypothetical protein VAE055_420564 [Vibrio aestuarianus]CAH8226670.1 hypothetical protein VAE032_330039 [Vibrio aestuarianus]
MIYKKVMCGKFQDLTLTNLKISRDDGHINITFRRQFQTSKQKKC